MTTTKLLSAYKNGNTRVRIFSDGTKERLVPFKGEATPEFPESVDFKITNYCDNPHCMKHCHEKSNPRGGHASLGEDMLDRFTGLPVGVELAIGGGNPLAHPELTMFLTGLKSRGVIANLTVNNYHVDKYNLLISWLLRNDLVKGLGVSWTPGSKDSALQLAKDYPNSVVFHQILGVNSVEDFDELLTTPNSKVLLLGYKNYGNGAQFYKSSGQAIERHISRFKEVILDRLKQKHTFCFDNLALTQLDLKSQVPSSLWNNHYMGDDGTFTFYIDAVSGSYAKNSTSKDKTKIGKADTIISMFQAVRKCTTTSEG